MAPALVVAVALASAAPTAPADAGRAAAFMRDTIGLSAAQIASVDAGEVVTTQLSASDKGEIAAFGAIRVHGDRAAFLHKVADDVGRSRPGLVQPEWPRHLRLAVSRPADALPMDAQLGAIAALRAHGRHHCCSRCRDEGGGHESRKT